MMTVEVERFAVLLSYLDMWQSTQIVRWLLENRRIRQTPRRANH